MIEAELFESAQEQLAENRRRHRQRCAGVRYLLQGLLVCRKCGYAFCGRWQPRYPREPGPAGITIIDARGPRAIGSMVSAGAMLGSCPSRR